MKKKNTLVGKAKSSMTAILLVLLAAGWLCALYSMTVDRDLRDQTALIRSADIFLEDKLYIRAVNVYLQALSDYQTENNAQIEETLADIYREGGMWDAYYELLADRISAGRAGADEYLELAQYYLDSGNSAYAVRYLEQGCSVFPDDQELTALDESARYEVSKTETVYQSVGTASSDYYFPAFDGEKWGYILENGRTALDFQYEEALRFSGSYAVVKLDGVYTLIDKNGYWNAVDKNGLDEVTSICGTRIVGVRDGSCGIYSNTFSRLSAEEYEDVCLNADGSAFVRKNGKWALLDEKLQPVTDYIFTDVAKNSFGEAFYGGYAVVADEQGYYLIRADGEPCFDARFAAAKGIESGLVAVSDGNGLWGYCDETGELVVDFRYEDAKSFSGRLGAVRYAGKWGYINKYDTMVIPNEYEDASPFQGRIALVRDEQGYVSLLELEHYDIYMNEQGEA